MDNTVFRFNVGQSLLSLVAAFLVYSLSRAIYNVTLHPLAKLPGPKLRGAFYFPQFYDMYSGQIAHNRHRLHQTYGDFVRVSPNLVSTIKSEAWRDIYGYGNKQPMQKCPDLYVREAGHTGDILSASNDNHTRMRRLLNHAFSEQALRSQEDIINSYVTLMITKLQKHATADSPVDIMKYLNFTTFDITGDLSFDESFGSLQSENYNDWIANIFGAIRISTIVRVLLGYGLPVFQLFNIIPPLKKMKDTHLNDTIEKTARRLAKKTDRKDFLSYILKHNDDRGMTHNEIMMTMGTIVIAGSETSATTLSGAVYYLLTNPAWLSKLQQEIRAAFKSNSEITFTSLTQLKTLHSVIQETMRMYPPVPIALTRVVPEGGAVVAGTYIPSKTSIGVAQYSAYRSARNFKDPDTFDPSRWTGDEKYANDQRSVVQPFSTGPRNCIGQSLAWAEMRLILARLIWNFDMELLDESSDWATQKTFVLWDKPPLMVRLSTR